MKWSGRTLGVVAAVAVLSAAGAVVWAAIPSPDGTITACYKTKNGALRVIDVEANQNCDKSEAVLEWPSQAGGSGAQTAYAYLNSDGSLDTASSKNIQGISRTQTATDDDGTPIYRYCYDIAFVPKWAQADGTVATGQNVRGLQGKGSEIDANCGPQFDAFLNGVRTPYNNYNLAFLD
jgi:hypothetical protein